MTRADPELVAQSRSSLHDAQGRWHPGLSDDLEQVLLHHLHPSPVLQHPLGQYLPELVIAHRTGWSSP